MASQEQFSEQKRWFDLANTIEALKGGQRSETLDFILSNLRSGKIELARTECFSNADKIVDRFPKIKEILAEQLFDKNERNPLVFRLPPDTEGDDEEGGEEEGGEEEGVGEGDDEEKSGD